MSDALDIAAAELPQIAPADQIDLVCDAFEDSWIRGEAPRIEDYLDRCDASVRKLLLAELLLVDREFRIKQGENASRQDYQQRFPDYSTIIDGLEFATIADHGGKRSRVSRVGPVAIPGEKVAHFELLEQLGSGASGTVWKARDTRLRRIVAVKIPRQECLTDTECERFLREGQACAQLRHPNIVATHEVGDDHGRVFIVAEYIEGLNLREWLKQRQPKPREAAELAAQLAEALHHAHEQGVIHRDLKPANVLMDSDGRPHITDFGLAKWTTDSAGMTVEGNILGTPAYMSPEQARGNAFDVDRRTDVYGLGALLYELLTSHPPFEGEVATIVHKVIHDEPRPPRRVESSVPRDLETICLKAIEKEPSRRYPSAQEMAVDLRRFLRGEPILARRAGRIEQSYNWLKRRPAAAALLILAMVAASAIGMVGKLTEENYELRGLRTVKVATEPPSAKIAFLPLNEKTGEPVLAKAVYASGVTPLKIDLRPGDYFVIAALPNQRFHEVLRHIPALEEQISFAYHHRSWSQASDGCIQLPTIRIPNTDVVGSMTLIDGSDEFAMGISTSAKLPEHRRSMASFFVDSTEFTFGDYKRHVGRLPYKYHDDPPADDSAMSVSYDDAVAYAEDLGKRLPSEAEYEYLATGMGQMRFPWGSKFPHVTDAVGTTIVRAVKFDRLAVDPPVYGLCSNLAEWTYSYACLYPPYPSDFNLPVLTDYRVVRGGNRTVIDGNPIVSADARNPRHREYVLRYDEKIGVGFRGVRSAEPLIKYKDL